MTGSHACTAGSGARAARAALEGPGSPPEGAEAAAVEGPGSPPVGLGSPPFPTAPALLPFVGDFAMIGAREIGAPLGVDIVVGGSLVEGRKAELVVWILGADEPARRGFGVIALTET